MNPITYKEFFDFSDDREIRKAEEDIKSLKKAYDEFTGSVTGDRISLLSRQQDELVLSIRELVKESSTLNITNKQSQQTILDLSAALAAHTAAINENKGAKRDAKTAEEALAGSVDGLTQRLRNQLAEYNKLDPAVDGHLEKMLNLAKATQQTREAIKQLTAETKLNTTAYTAAAGSYQELDQQTRQMVQDLKQLAGGMSSTSVEATRLKTQIFENTQRLKEFDASMNQNFRNVGNYKSAFNGLNVATSQLFRELPALAINANTFFLAISNNLPMLFDEIQKIRAAQQAATVASEAAAVAAAAQAEAEAVAAGATLAHAEAAAVLAREQALANAAQLAAPSVLKALTSSLFSWNTLLTVGILALTLFGGKIADFVSGLFSGKDAIDEAKQSLELLNKAFEDSSVKKAVQAVDELTIKVDLAKRGFISKTDVLEDYNKTLGNSIGQATSLDQIEQLLTDHADAYIRMTLLKAAANKALEEASSNALEAEKQRQSNELSQTTGFERFIANSGLGIGFGGTSLSQLSQRKTDKIAAATQAQTVNENIAKGLLGNAAAIAAQNGLDFYGEFGKKAKEIEEQRKAAEEAEKKAAAAREKAEREYQALLRKRIELIKSSADADIAQAEYEYAISARSSYDQIALEEKKRDIQVEAALHIMQLVQKGTNEYVEATDAKLTAERTFDANVRQITERRKDEEIRIMDELAARRAKTADAQMGANAAQAGLGIEYGAGQIRLGMANGSLSQSDGQRQLFDMEAGLIQQEIAFRRQAVNAAIEGTEDYYNKKRELLAAERDLIKLTSDYEISKAEEVKAKKERLAEASVEFAATLANVAIDIFSQQYSAEAEALEQQKAYELSLVGTNAVAKKKIEDQFTKDMANNRRNQAEAAKFEALFNIAINTAQAVMKSVAASPTTFGLPFSAFAIATGIAQGALVAARRIPQYWKGRGKGRDEFAEINEQGFELIEDSRGNMRVEAAGKRTVTWLKADEKVHTHEQSKQMLAAEYGVRANASSFAGSLASGLTAYAREQDARENRIVNALAANGINNGALAGAFKQALADLPMEQHTFDESGYRKFVTQNNTRIESLNERQKLGGQG